MISIPLTIAVELKAISLVFNYERFQIYDLCGS